MTNPDPSFHAVYGWQYRNHAGQWQLCPPPFAKPQDAVAYALRRLRSDDSVYAIIVDARAALAWAEKAEDA